MARLLFVAALSIALSGCALVLDFDGFEVSGPDGGDAGTLDGGGADAGDGGVPTDAPIPDGCVPADGGEVCNGEDDDCNGAIDDLDPPPNDTESCGACFLGCADTYECIDRHCTDEVTTITGGDAFTCVRMRSGELWCFGANDQGQLGIGTTSDHEALPQRLGSAEVSAVVDVGAGAQHACAVAGTNTFCWGFNDRGQLADDTNTRRLDPVATTMGGDATRVVAGDAHTCILTSGLRVRCAGDNEFGQIGLSFTTTDRPRFTEVTGLTNVQHLAAGANHNCAIRTTGAVQCWGDNSSGQLGVDVVESVSTPVSPDLLVTATAVAAGDAHTCVISTDEDVLCWGSNASGQLGNGSTEDSTSAVEVAGLGGGNAKALTAGGSHTCAIVETLAGDAREVYCWGANGDGQLGDGSRDDRMAAVQVEGITRAVAIGAGGSHTCVAEVDPDLGGPTLRCWGLNSTGQLGTGSTSPGRIVTPMRSTLPP